MIAALLLVAGESRRMGAQKALLPLGDTTVIGHILDRLEESMVEDIVVVTGYQSDRIAEAISGRPIRLVLNPAYKDGMLTSVRCGLESMPSNCEAVMLVLGDQPGITSALVNSLLREFDATEQPILVPVHKGRRGHPLVFSTSYRREIMTSFDEVGLRGLLRAHPADVLEFPVATDSVLMDMDFPEDYEREQAIRKIDSARSDLPR